MHVLIIPSEHFMTKQYPLGGIFQLDQARALHDAGNQVGIIAPGVITLRFLLRRYPYSDFEFLNGFPVLRKYVRKNFPQRWAIYDKSVTFYQNLGFELYREYKKRFGPPDVVHAHNLQYAGSIAQIIKERENVPYIITEHSTRFMTESLSEKEKKVMKESVLNASAITAVGRALAKDIDKQIGVNRIDILPNIVDSNFFNKKLNNNKKTSGFVFLNIAGMVKRKNQAALIEAFALHFKNTQVSLRIGGTGELYRQLKKLSERLGVDKQVVFLGHLDRESIQREMQVADCFVLSSFKETFGVVLIEALACGIPVIAVRNGGAEDIVNDKNGLLVIPGNNEALGAAMLQMTKTKSRYQATALRDECESRYGEEAFVKNATKIYLRAMGQSN